MSKFEKAVYLGAPWFFGMTLIIIGIVLQTAPAAKLHGLLAVCTGLVCMSIWCVCSVLTKILEAKKD